MSCATIKTFNTSGPCVPSEHYMLPVLPRQPEVEAMIKGKYYFVLHAPRQSGKTTFLKAITKSVNAQGEMYALYCSMEICQGVTDDSLAITRITAEINTALKISGVANLAALAFPDDSLPRADTSVRVRIFKQFMCKS